MNTEPGGRGAAGQRRKLPWFGRLYLWACNRLYNEFAWAYDWVSWLVSLGHWWGWRLAALEYVPPPRPSPNGGGGPRVLEVGFGTGDLLIEMARRGWDVWGLDLSPAMQRVTARKLQKRGLWVPRTRARVQQMPFPDGAFDAVVTTFPAEFILQLPALREFARVLRTGGRLVVGGVYIQTDTAAFKQAFHFVFGLVGLSRLPRYGDLIDQVGLRVTEVEHAGRFARVQIIIAEK